MPKWRGEPSRGCRKKTGHNTTQEMARITLQLPILKLTVDKKSQQSEKYISMRFN